MYIKNKFNCIYIHTHTHIYMALFYYFFIIVSLGFSAWICFWFSNLQIQIYLPLPRAGYDDVFAGELTNYPLKDYFSRAKIILLKVKSSRHFLFVVLPG